MVNFNLLFKACGYHTKKQQISFFQLLIACQAFAPVPTLAPYNETEYHESYALHHDRLKNAAQIWHQSRLNDYSSVDYKSIEITKHLMTDTFNTIQDGLSWLISILNERCLLPDFHKKSGFIEKINLDNRIQHHFALIKKSLKLLGMLQGNAWPIRDEIGHVILPGEMDDVIKTRLTFIQDFNGNLYYLTNPRGLFNHEASLAPILADWFELSGSEPVIQSVLNQHRNMHMSHKNWLHNLPGLKTDILNALQLHFGLNTLTWPGGKGHYYYEAVAAKLEARENAYDVAALDDNRASLINWPTAADMVHYYLTLERKENHRFTRVNLVPVLARGHHKPATMSDCFAEWLRLYKQDVPARALLVVVSGNEKNHAFLYNKAVIESHLVQETQFNTIIVGPGARNILFRRALSEFGKSIYQREPAILTQLLQAVTNTSLRSWHQQMRLSSSEPSDSNLFIWNGRSYHTIPDQVTRLTNVDEMIQSYELDFFLQYFQSKSKLFKKIHESLLLDQKYVLLIMVFMLARHYFKDGDYIKASGLFNFASNIADDLQKNKTGPFLFCMNSMSFESIAAFCHAMYGAHHVYDVKLFLHNKTHLATIRQSILNDVNYSPIASTKNNVLQIYDAIQLKMNALIMAMINYAIQSSGIPPLDFAIIMMGSYARGEATPFSDIEFFILIQHANADALYYFKQVTKFLLLELFQLGETVLPALGLQTVEHGIASDLCNKTHDPVTHQGVSMDPYLPWASKTPLGKKEQGVVVYRLIGTADDIVTKTGDYSTDVVLPLMLLSGAFLMGSRSLYSEYEDQIRLRNYLNYGLFILTKDIARYLSFDYSAQKRISHKIALLKPLQVLLDDLSLLFGGQGKTRIFDKLDLLLRHRIITWKHYAALELTIADFMLIKLREHFRFGRQRIDIVISPLIRCHNQSIRQLYCLIDGKLRQHEINMMQREKRLSIVAYCRSKEEISGFGQSRNIRFFIRHLPSVSIPSRSLPSPSAP